MNAIGVDIGGTKVKAGVISHEGTVLANIVERTNKQELMNQVLYLIEKLLQEHSRVQGIGIATAGIVNMKNGSIHSAASNLPEWAGTKVKDIVETKFHLPAAIDNDANCAAYAELKVGAALDTHHFVCITLGTGVGAGIISKGEILHGKNGGAGEVGHMIFSPNGRQCNCGKKGCWEQYVSGSALVKDISEFDIWGEQRPKPEEIFKLAHKKHPIAIEIVNRFCENLAIGIVSLQRILDVDCFVIGGGVLFSNQYWWNHFLYALKEAADVAPKVRKAMLQNDSGMIGAALMAMGSAKVQSN